MTLHGRIADELTMQARPTFIHAMSHIYQEGAVLGRFLCRVLPQGDYLNTF